MMYENTFNDQDIRQDDYRLLMAGRWQDVTIEAQAQNVLWDERQGHVLG